MLSPSLRLFAIAIVVACLGCAQPDVCKPGQVPTPVRSAPSAIAGQHIHGHAHNDYEHTRPLEDALAQRFYSVEADVWFDGGNFKVAHNSWDATKGTLAALYLDPLQERVTTTGSVYGDGVPFTLWIDLKDGDEKLPEYLHDLLNKYAMLSQYTDEETTPGAVTIVLTGDAKMKKEALDFPTRRAVRDSNDFSLDDPAADRRWTHYALSWGNYLSWNGTGSIPAEQGTRMACILENAHENGRKVRFFSTPDKSDDWGAQLANGVDYVNTDHLAEMNTFLEGAP